MAGIISNVDGDVQKLRKLKNEIENVKKALKGINITVDIDIAKGLQSQLTSLLSQYDALVDKVAVAEGKIMLSTKRINDAAEKIIKAQEKISKSVGVPAQTGNVNAQANTAETASIQAQAKAYDDLKAEIDGILGARDANVKRMVDEAFTNHEYSCCLVFKCTGMRLRAAIQAQQNDTKQRLNVMSEAHIEPGCIRLLNKLQGDCVFAIFCSTEKT